MIESHKITIAGRERRFTFGFREGRFIEEKTGFRMLTGQPGHVPPDSIAFFLVVLQAGLLRDGAPSEEEVLDMLDPLSSEEFEELVLAVRAAYEASVFRPREEEEGAEDPPEAPPPNP